jgi:hypothetical protein
MTNQDTSQSSAFPTVTVPQPQPAMTSTLPCITGHPMECAGELSDTILQAARAAMPADPYRSLLIADPGRLNRPVLPLLVALLDAAHAVAGALAENSWDDFRPIDQHLAAGLVKQTQQIAAAITTSTHATPPGYSLPSMTGKELV